MRKFMYPRPYIHYSGKGYDIATPSDFVEYQFNEGLTALIGGNGTGKSTLLQRLRVSLKEEGVKNLYFNLSAENKEMNMKHNKSESFLPTCIQSSTGEQHSLHIGDMAQEIGTNIRGGKDKELWILIDAIDDGLSLDIAGEVEKYLFRNISNDIDKEANKGRHIYVVFSVNNFEVLGNHAKINIATGEEENINSYEDFRRAVLRINVITKNARENFYDRLDELESGK